MKKYCGTHTLPEWLNNFLSYFHNDACKLHDYHYESKIHRISADFIFLKNMFLSGWRFFLKSLGMLLLALPMFVFVLFFGFIFYKKGAK